MVYTYEAQLTSPDRWFRLKVTDPDGTAVVEVASQLKADTLEADWSTPDDATALVLLEEAIRQLLGDDTRRFFVHFNWYYRQKFTSGRLYIEDQEMRPEIWVAGRDVAVPAASKKDFMAYALTRVERKLIERASSDHLRRTMTREQMDHPAFTAGGLTF